MGTSVNTGGRQGGLERGKEEIQLAEQDGLDLVLLVI